MKTLQLKATAFLAMTAMLATACGKADSYSDSSREFFDEPEMLNDELTADDSEAGSGFTDAPAVPEGMTVTFEDDFVNSTGQPDPDKWSLCEKGDASWNRYLSGSYSQAYTSDGFLYLVGEQKDGQYLTGGIETRGKFEFEHGRVECRARFAKMAQGSHEGIWMMPAPPAEQWPKSGELDIMEHLNMEDNIWQTVHNWYADDMGHKDDPVAQNSVDVNKDEFNIYGLEWTKEKVTYTVNGEKYLEYPNLGLSGEDGAYQWPFNHPFYLILSISLGGEDTWAGPITDSQLPAVFEIDWIRVMQWEDSDGGTTSVPRVTAD